MFHQIYELMVLGMHPLIPYLRRNRSAPSRSNGCARKNIAASKIKFTTWVRMRSEEHTSELQSRVDLVCRLLLEKKKKNSSTATSKDEIRTRSRDRTSTSGSSSTTSSDSTSARLLLRVVRARPSRPRTV